MSLEQKVVLVAGGAGAVGEGIVRQFLQAGATVVVPSRGQERLDNLRAQMGDAATNLVTMEGDIGDEAGAATIRDRIRSDVGELAHVVASLGGWWQGQPVTEVALDLWHQLIDGSLTAHFIVAKTFLPLLRGTNGSYTLINGGGGLDPVPQSGPISVSAAGQLMLGQVLAAENEEQSVRINNLVLATPVITRSRPDGPDGWISADDAGRRCVAIAQGGQSDETIIFEGKDE